MADKKTSSLPKTTPSTPGLKSAGSITTGGSYDGKSTNTDKNNEIKKQIALQEQNKKLEDKTKTKKEKTQNTIFSKLTTAIENLNKFLKKLIDNKESQNSILNNNKIITAITNIDTNIKKIVDGKDFTLKVSVKDPINFKISEDNLTKFFDKFGDNTLLNSIKNNIQSIKNALTNVSNLAESSSTTLPNTTSIDINNSSITTVLKANTELLQTLNDFIKNKQASSESDNILAKNLSEIYDHFKIDQATLQEIADKSIKDFTETITNVAKDTISNINESITNIYQSIQDKTNTSSSSPTVSTITNSSTVISTPTYENFFSSLTNYLKTDTFGKTILSSIRGNKKENENVKTITETLIEPSTKSSEVSQQQITEFIKNFNTLHNQLKEYVDNANLTAKSAEKSLSISVPHDSLSTNTQQLSPITESIPQSQSITYTQKSLVDSTPSLTVQQQKYPQAMAGLSIIGNKAARLDNAVFSINGTQQSMVSDVPNIVGLNIPDMNQVSIQKQELLAILSMASTLNNIKDILSNHFNYLKSEKEREQLYKDTLESEELSNILQGGSKDNLDLLDQNQKQHKELLEALLKRRRNCWCNDCYCCWK